MKSLSKDEMKKVMGGVRQERIIGGGCTGSVGEWTYTSGDATGEQCIADVLAYCSSGDGYCTTVWD